MEHEYEVLNHLQENELTTQRKISSRTGLSLGAVNLLLKKMARKGLVKIERLNARAMRYILTPKGIEEKSRLAYRYVRQSYRLILKINQSLDCMLTERAEGIKDNAVLLYGPYDEIMEILTRHLKHREVSYQLCPDIDSLDKLTSVKDRLIIIWREEEEEDLNGYLNVINIMKIL